eukprot:COSAG02_NODE_1020_length_15166_cov_48.849671_3_plen_47_part_00
MGHSGIASYLRLAQYWLAVHPRLRHQHGVARYQNRTAKELVHLGQQ